MVVFFFEGGAFFFKHFLIIEVLPNEHCLFIWSLSVSVRAFPSNHLQFIFSENCCRGICDTGLRTGGLLQACHWLSNPVSYLGWTWPCPSHRVEVWSFLFVSSARLFGGNQFIFTWQASCPKLFSWNVALTYLESVLVLRSESLKPYDHWNSLRLPLNTPVVLFQTWFLSEPFKGLQGLFSSF